MQANNTKTMFVVNPNLGLIRIHSRSNLVSTLTDSLNATDDVGLTLRIDDNLNQPNGYQQDTDRWNAASALPNVDLSIPFNVTSNVVVNKQVSKNCDMGSNIRRDFFQAFLQPTPLTPAQSPPHADEHCQSPNFLCNSAWLERQTSLSIALEVLGEPTALAEDHFPPTPPSENQEDQYLSHPSPSYIEFLSPLPNRSTRTRTVSDHTEYVSSSICLDDNARFRAFSADNSTKIFDGDYTPASSHQSDVNSDSGSSSDKENENESKSNASASSGSSTVTTTAASCNLNEKESSNPGLTSLPSFLKAACENPEPADGDIEGSLDMVGMLRDFLDDSDCIQQERAEYAARLKEAIATDHCYAAKQASTVDAQTSVSRSTTSNSFSERNTSPVVTSSQKIVVDLTADEPGTSSSVPKLVKTPSYIRKRTQNNRACRESRRKRKAERDEAEHRVKFLVQDNEDMRKKIQELEVEVKQTRALLISRMVNQ